MGINDFFSAYYGEKIIKPNELAYKSAQGMYKSYECLIVGDDKKLDIDIPKKLGFKTIYVNKKGDINSVEELSPKLIKKLKNRVYILSNIINFHVYFFKFIFIFC